MANQTTHEYTEVITMCKELFVRKTKDYGASWRILRLPSITDQIFIKAQRIRTIQEKKTQKVNDSISDEFIGIINYCIMAMIQAKLGADDQKELSYAALEPLYDEAANSSKALLQNKNHDYDEAWRNMRVSSMTDIILMKLLRVKQIENNNGMTLVSEGVMANYQDIINYSVFCLLKLKENPS